MTDQPPDVPRASRAEVEAVAGPLSDEEWGTCEAIVAREAEHGIEVTAAYLAFAVGRPPTG